MVTPSTLLILDEPTNHLDIPSKEMLEVGCSFIFAKPNHFKFLLDDLSVLEFPLYFWCMQF
jgi:ABC-type molybdenum transport system ATPase subunit/photorepair protein PhrA